MAFRRSRFSRRRPIRRRRRTFRRRVTRGRRSRPRASFRRIKNIASDKRKDNMMPVPISAGDTGSGSPPAAGTPGTAYTMGGDGIYAFLWAASARRQGTAGDTWTFKASNSQRQATRVFLKGLREQMSFETDTSAEWIHRRVVFLEGTRFIPKNFPSSVADHHDGTNGYLRAMWPVLNPQGTEPGTSTWNALRGLIYDGSFGNDWTNPFTAKMDSQRITVLYDKIRKIRGGNNGRGTWQMPKYWHPVNKVLVYNDDEEGAAPMFTDPWSSGSKDSCGDLCVIDLFACAGGAASDHANLGFQSTLYWHEGGGY